MYTIPQIDIKVRLICDDGSVSTYDSYQYFIEHTSYYFVERNMATTFRDCPLKRYMPWLGIDTKLLIYVLRDDFGSVFSTSEILNDIKVWNKQNYIGRCNRQYDHVYRTTPVPYTGKKSWRFKHYYKKPKTTQERRWSCAHNEYVRGKRRCHILPNSWDDCVRGDVSNRRCWKSHKRIKQWT